MDHSSHTLLQAGSQAAVSDRMRELLARAAQDHVYEQRTQGAVLDEIRQRLEGMEWLLREVRERELGGLNGSVEAVSVRLDDIVTRPPSWAEGLAQHVELVRDHVDAVNVRVGGIGDRVTPLAELPSLWADVSTVGESVEEALSRLQSLLDGAQGMAERMERYTALLGQVQEAMEAAAGRFTRLDKALTELGQRTERLEGGVLDLTGVLTGAVQELTTTVEQATGKVLTRLGDLESRQAATIARLDRIDGRIETADECLADIDTRLTGVESRLTGVETHQGHHDDRFEALDGRVDTRFTTLDERLTAADQRAAAQATALNEDLGTRIATLDTELSTRIVTLGESLGARLTTLDESVGDRVAALDGTLLTRISDLDDRVGDRLDSVDDRVEAVSQRVGQLPATLEIGALHKNLGELAADQAGHFENAQARLAEAAGALTELIGARPDQDRLAETLTKTLTQSMDPAHADMTRRLGILEETMLALAEALLRPTRTGKD
ncbi:hypothetical protein [Acrocarpospora catenulata]|uniref:hypothetical protein n=1 Tax=Acrocarpospora catenulata TaxID=2836182 RepID=UPI001BDA6B50|nr:hypothetical protein [Acrocarpospora catenulata]